MKVGVMYRYYLVVAAAVLWGAIAAAPATASDGGSMDMLSAYLHAHRLPLVEARLITDEDGGRRVLLYGFVATPYGKRDAEDQARGFLDDPEVAIVNRIKIRPELLNLGRPANNADSMQAAAGDSEDESAENSAALQPLPDDIGDQQAYADQERDDQMLMNSGTVLGGIPMAMAIFGSGAIFPPLAPPIFPGPIYRTPFPPIYTGPGAYSPPPTVVIIRPSFAPPSTAFTGFPSGLRGPSPFPAGPTPMFPATGGLPPFAAPVNPVFPGSFATHGGFGGGFGNGGFGGFGGSFGNHR
jgi:hypothetical protein